MTVEWALAGVMARSGLDLLTRGFLLIASCVTPGHAMPQLRAHIGGVATSNALRIAKEVFQPHE
jgi:4-carboxymuconolactone decarboxylase